MYTIFTIVELTIGFRETCLIQFTKAFYTKNQRFGNSFSMLISSVLCSQSPILLNSKDCLPHNKERTKQRQLRWKWQKRTQSGVGACCRFSTVRLCASLHKNRTESWTLISFYVQMDFDCNDKRICWASLPSAMPLNALLDSTWEFIFSVGLNRSNLNGSRLLDKRNRLKQFGHTILIVESERKCKRQNKEK